MPHHGHYHQEVAEESSDDDEAHYGALEGDHQDELPVMAGVLVAEDDHGGGGGGGQGGGRHGRGSCVEPPRAVGTDHHAVGSWGRRGGTRGGHHRRRVPRLHASGLHGWRRQRSALSPPRAGELDDSFHHPSHLEHNHHVLTPCGIYTDQNLTSPLAGDC